MVELFNLKDVSFSYNENEEPRVFALNNINATIHENFFTAIVGKEKSGKSTLLDLLRGELKLIHGEISYYNNALKGLSKSEIKNIEHSLVYIEDKPIDDIESDMKLKDYLEKILLNHHFKKENVSELITRIADACCLTKLLNRTIEYFLVKDRKRLYLAQSIIKQKQLLIIEDIDKLIDKKKYEDFMLLVRDLFKERTIIMTMESPKIFIDYVDRVLALDEGCLVRDEIYSTNPRKNREF